MRSTLPVGSSPSRSPGSDSHSRTGRPVSVGLRSIVHARASLTIAPLAIRLRGASPSTNCPSTCAVFFQTFVLRASCHAAATTRTRFRAGRRWALGAGAWGVGCTLMVVKLGGWYVGARCVPQSRRARYSTPSGGTDRAERSLGRAGPRRVYAQCGRSRAASGAHQPSSPGPSAVVGPDRALGPARFSGQIKSARAPPRSTPLWGPMGRLASWAKS